MGMTVAWIALVALVAAATPGYIGHWKGRGIEGLRARYRTFWPYGEAALEGWVRAQMAIYLSMCCLVLAYPLLVFSHNADPAIRDWMTGLGKVAAIGFVGMFVIAISITLFNVPRSLALPSLRDSEGAMISWWRKRDRAGSKPPHVTSRDAD